MSGNGKERHEKGVKRKCCSDIIHERGKLFPTKNDLLPTFVFGITFWNKLSNVCVC